MKTKLMSGIAAALALTACEPQVETVDFKDGLPGDGMVSVGFPSKSGGSLDDARRALSAGEPHAQAYGDVSGTWAVTAGTTLAVNGLTLWGLAALKGVTSFEPTSVDGDVAVFGPRTDERRITWRLTTTRTAPNAFEYLLDARPEGAGDSAYVTVISGEHTVAVGDDGRALRGYGEGRFLIAYDKTAALTGQPRTSGTIDVRYARPSPTAAVTVDVDLVEQQAGGTPTTAAYRYSQVPAGPGSFEFAVDANLHWYDPSRPALERWSIKSRWLSDGSGRADVRARGGDLGQPEDLNECWDTRFRSTFLGRSDTGSPTWGTEAQGCTLLGASYSSQG